MNRQSAVALTVAVATVVALNCGTGAGGFQEGNSCAKGGGAADSGHVEHAPADIVAGIQKAVAERPGRATHGNTGTNAFVLVGDKVYSWNEHEKWKGSNGVMVHSHSGENWQDYEKRAGEPEAFDPLNAADMKLFINGLRTGDFAQSALMMADGRLEIVRPSATQTAAQRADVFKLAAKPGRKAMEKLLHADYATRSKIYEATGKKGHEQSRDMLRDFCNHYGFDFLENLRWR